MSEKDYEVELEDEESTVDEEVESHDSDEDNSEDSDERIVAERDDEDDDSDEDESDNAKVREKRKRLRLKKKQDQREREETLRRELASRDTLLNEMRAKIDVIERRNSGSELAQLETAKKQAAQAYAQFKEQIRIAGEAGNYAAQADAFEKMGMAQRKFDEITNIEKAYKERKSAPQPLDPRLATHAQEWMNRNKWYDPNAKDTDSRLVMTLDQQLSEEGLDPTTTHYWSELESRVKKYLPHRFESGITRGTKPKSVVSGSGRENASGANKGTYNLSGERVQALKEAGMWDDPKARAEAIKQYREYDKQNKA